MRRDPVRTARVALLALVAVGLLGIPAAAVSVAEAAPQVIFVGGGSIQGTIDDPNTHNGDVLILDAASNYSECIYVWKKLTILGQTGSAIICDSPWALPAAEIVAGGVRIQGLAIRATGDSAGQNAVLIRASNVQILTNVLANDSTDEEEFAVQVGSVWDSQPRKFNLIAGNELRSVGGGIQVGDYAAYCCPIGTNRDSDNTLLNNLIAGPCCDGGYGGTAGDGIHVLSKANHVNFNVILGADSEALELVCPNASFDDVGKCSSAPDKNQLAHNVLWDSDEDDVFFETNVKSTKDFNSNTFDTCDDVNSNNLCP